MIVTKSRCVMCVCALSRERGRERLSARDTVCVCVCGWALDSNPKSKSLLRVNQINNNKTKNHQISFEKRKKKKKKCIVLHWIGLYCAAYCFVLYVMYYTYFFRHCSFSFSTKTAFIFKKILNFNTLSLLLFPNFFPKFP